MEIKYKKGLCLTKKMEEQLKELSKRNIQLEIINQIVKSLTLDMTFDEMMNDVAQKLEQVIAYDLLNLCVLEGGNLIVKTSVPSNTEALQKGTILDPATSWSWEVVRKKSFSLRPNIQDDGMVYTQRLDYFGIRAMIIVPLIARSGVLGTLNLGSKQIGAYTINDAFFLQQVADHLALIIENARLYREEQRVKQEWEETFKAVRDMLLVIDQDCNIIRFNQAVIDYAEGIQLLLENGKMCSEYFYPYFKDLCGFCPTKEVFVTGRPANRRLHLTSGRIWDISSYPIHNDEDKRINRVLMIIRDVTDKVYWEEHLIHSAKLAAIGEIAAGIAHELNSPLTAIIGNAMLLQRDFENLGRMKRGLLLEDIRRCAVRCNNIIQNLRTFAKQEEYSFESLNINEVVERALTLVAYQIEKRCIKIYKRLDEAIPTVMGSRQHLEQILINLLLNARDAVKGCKKKEIYVETGCCQRYVYISVKDTGCGIDPQQLPQIFNLFFTTKIDGTGLGLSISKKIAEAHGGRIEVESTLGAGSTFTLFIPL